VGASVGASVGAAVGASVGATVGAGVGSVSLPQDARPITSTTAVNNATNFFFIAFLLLICIDFGKLTGEYNRTSMICQAILHNLTANAALQQPPFEEKPERRRRD
jgi:hypothetical protein